jgi:SAM-dependent methyltransferase
MNHEHMRSLSPCFEVPANSSRFFDVHSEAISERLGKIHLVWDDACEIVCNEEFSSDLVKYDSKYCTSVSSIGSTYKILTLSYFDQVLSLTRQQPLVIDVGCGQGEFVSALRSKGINAVGFDPVLRTSDQYLIPKLWEPSDLIGDLYVLRCVLPHIQNPLGIYCTDF